MRRPRGFTLLELLLALSISAVVLGAAYALFRAGRSLSSRAEALAEISQAARAVLRRLEGDLRAAVRPSRAFDAGFRGTKGGTEALRRDRLEFVTATEAVPGGIDLGAVSYWIIEEGTGAGRRGLVRERRAALTAETVEAGRPENVEEVAPEVVGLGFRYFDEGEWREEWDSAAVGKLPRAVEATLWVRGEWRGEEVVERFLTRVYLPVAAEQPPEE
ncbi:MAG TPA: prepilin-type N-terminal cleavage/methylation domain-containing protein [Planctomycetota bacterium]|nr:prepilin-type N-terminal cleavage/methylation domain-containing protein [Planctomycetota bacterium]